MQTNIMPFLVWNEQLDTALEKIANGNTSEGYVVLSHFVNAVGSGNNPDPRAMKFIMDAFNEILSQYHAGDVIDFATPLKMKRSRGRASKNQYNLALQYGDEIMQLKHSGLTSKKAFASVAKKYKQTADTIEKYYTIYNKMVDE